MKNLRVQTCVGLLLIAANNPAPAQAQPDPQTSAHGVPVKR
ncbi:hypothetical protein [Bradyrhizobium sp. sBnM-33]|nr:hypothetical protein [Bradyrhizobium sp. sBnM-33]WOH47621.1 hypothetical protein RX328_26005 [Bradyrhizobium sp. sBnM-33]